MPGEEKTGSLKEEFCPLDLSLDSKLKEPSVLQNEMVRHYCWKHHTFWLQEVMAILGCQLDYIWYELKPKNGGHSYEGVLLNLEWEKSTSNPDL